MWAVFTLLAAILVALVFGVGGLALAAIVGLVLTVLGLVAKSLFEAFRCRSSEKEIERELRWRAESE